MDKPELDVLTKRKQQEVHQKALQHWALLRQSVCSVRKVLEEADVKDLALTHGIYRERKLNHHLNILQVLYIPQKQEYLTCDGLNFHIFQEDGQKKDIVQCEIQLNRVLFCHQTNQFVVWIEGQEDMFLMDRQFVIISQSTAVGPITMGAYNEKAGEVITVGPHFITSWIFRYGAKYLTPRKTTRTNFGQENMFSSMVLEDTASKSQRIFFALGTGIVVYNVFSGLELSRKAELHSQPITALTFFNPLKHIITGAKDGCIKVWDSNWKVLMVFVGHSKEVNFLSIYPHGTSFISASLDCTMRVWSMETCDEIDKTILSEPISGIGTEIDKDIFYTFTGKRVDLWRIQHLYQMHTNIGFRVNKIKITDHPGFPKRALLLCRDSSVRVVSPLNGHVITTLLLKPSVGLVDAVYAIAEDTIFALLASGEVIKASSACNPCRILSKWKCNNNSDVYGCLLVYEYVVDPYGDSDVWTKAQDSSNSSRTRKPKKSSKNRTLLLSGRKDGYICVLDWMNGEITYKVEAHENKSVISIISNTKLDQIISAGIDNIIKVWRLFPFAEEALAPLMSFYCAHTPTFMTAIKSSLGVAFHDPSTATFSVVLYDLTNNSRNDHKPDDDHMDVITGFTSCARMKLYGSCSLDGTIRIWDHNNSLIRLLKINAIPHSLSFCSPKGDILVGVNNHLFFISHKNYLPKYYLRRQICMQFLPAKTEEPLQFDENRLKAMDKNDVKRLKNAHASFKFTQYFDVLSLEEEEALAREKLIKEKAYGCLEIRDNEICQIRDGAMIAHNKPKSTKKTQNKAFKEYMKILHTDMKLKLPPEESMKEAVIRTLNQEIKDFEGKVEEEKKYRPESPPVGFFPELAQKNQGQQPSEHASLPSIITGYLPNSILLKILFPPPKPKEEDTEKVPYQPPKLTRKQLAEIQSLNPRRVIQVDEEDIAPDPPARNVTFASDERLTRVLELDLSDEEKREGPVGEKEKSSSDMNTSAVSSSIPSRATTDLSGSEVSAQEQKKSRLQEKKKKKSIRFAKDLDSSDEDNEVLQPAAPQRSSLMSKFQEIMDKPPLQKDQERKEIEKETVKREAVVTVKSSPSPVESLKRPSPQPLKPVTKLVSRPRPQPVAITPRSPTPTLPPPPPPTPLPGFITEFIGTQWFDKYFPDCNTKTMPKPWTGDTFVNMISKLIRIADWLHKVCVTEAILSIHSSEGLSDPTMNSVVKSLVAVLNHQSAPPTSSVAEQKEFILAALKAIAALAVRDKEVVAELVVQFLDGDEAVRSVVLEVLGSLGLQDHHRQFQKELDSWDIWSLEEKTRRSALHDKAAQWLDRWMAAYKLKIQDTVEKLQSGQALQGRLSTVDSTRRTSTLPSDRSTVTTLPVGGAKSHKKESLKTGRTSTTSFNSIAITLDNLHGSSILESVTYIDSLNFFCEMMMERELELLRRGEVSHSSREGTTDSQHQPPPKNTVLVLPKISHKPALVRLGHMHTSICHANRETSLHANYGLVPNRNKGRQQIPGDIRGFVPYINLPMKPVLLQPFASNMFDQEDMQDQDMYENTVLITLRSSQKYFIPSSSHVPMRDDHLVLVR